jgi:cytochrome P450
VTGHHAPVVDWATDFDHADPQWAARAPEIWDELRATCPVAHSERYGGVWLPTRHADVSAIAYDTEHFTSQSVVVTEGRPLQPAPQGIAPPISSDPPFHHEARRLLLPAFAPKAVAPLEPFTRAFCNQLLDDVADKAVVDAATDYAQHIPTQIIAKMLGFPLEDGDIFRSFVHNALEAVDLPVEQRMENFGKLDAYLTAQVMDHIDNPRDDLTTFLLNAEMDGQPLNPAHVGGTIVLLLIAGIDTTWSTIGASLYHLATHPDDLARLVAEPDLLPTAIEEFLRYYAPVTMARLVKDDVDFNGCPMKANEWVLLPFPSANRDPEFWDRPDEVLIDREINRHAAFGLGIHRCAGSNLARMEVRVAIETWLERYPKFHLADEHVDDVTWSGGQVRGPRVLPLTIG